MNMRSFILSLLFLTSISPAYAALIVTNHLAHADVWLGSETLPTSLSPLEYDDVVFTDIHTGGIDFDLTLQESGFFNGLSYSGTAIARGFRKAASPDIFAPSPSFNPVFGTLQVTDDEAPQDMATSSSSLIDALILFTMTDADALGHFNGFAEFSLGPGIELSYRLYDMTAGTTIISPASAFISQQVPLLDGHDYALLFHSLRSLTDATSQFTFFADTDVIYTDVPTPASLLLFGTGLLGLLLSRRLKPKRA
ncbi:MAG: PEP-CTERM sorting domain-containing protein [Candidatus Thiodiazotropha sp. (ex Monitilora ramsayi)]|nr:PEP-CTERM sorting domain-containing protein [Candidatus Thiodiazotropha sp. (ex Monitilora ramsayi)]